MVQFGGNVAAPFFQASHPCPVGFGIGHALHQCRLGFF
jgi:hypothetical protein